MLDIVKQIACNSLVIRSVQQQKNRADCVLFAITFASALTFGGDPSTVTFNAALLTAHLIRCLDNNLMLEFPVTEKRVIKCKPDTSIVELYCVCRMPNWRTDEILSSSK